MTGVFLAETGSTQNELSGQHRLVLEDAALFWS
jgi:hypothetical protein